MKTFLILASYAESVINFRGYLIESLLSQGLEVHVAVPDLKSNKKVLQVLMGKRVTLHEIRLSRTGMNPLTDIRTMRDLYVLMRKINPAWVLAYTVKPVVYGLLAARFAGVPHRNALITGLGYAFQGEGEGEGKRSKLRLLVEKLYCSALRGADNVFFQNPDDESLFRLKGILDPGANSCVVNGSGIPVDVFAVKTLPTSPRFLLIARLLGDKGIREYAEAAKRVKSRYPDAAFQLAGWIDDNPDAIKDSELASWTASGVIEFIGRLDDVRAAIEDCSVYVLPSYREGTPRTVLEAMAMGRPIITTDAPGCRETVLSDENGFLVPVKSIDRLAEAMERFILDPDLAVRMGKRSRELAVEKYDVHKVNAVMLREMGIV